MTEAHKQPNYIAIFWWLLALTILEVGVIFMPLSRMLIAILLVRPTGLFGAQARSRHGRHIPTETVK